MSALFGFFLGVTTLIWVGAAVLWIQVYRAPENTAIQFFAATLTLLGVNFTINVVPGASPPVELLMINLLALATGFAKIGFFLSVVHGRDAAHRISRQAVLVGVVAIAASAAWALAPAELRAVLPGPEAAGHPTGLLFSLTVTAYLGYVSLRTVIWVIHLVPLAHRRVLRVSLVIIGIGGAAHLVNSVLSPITSISLFVSGRSVVPNLGIYGALLSAIGFASLIIGALIPIVAGVIQEVPIMRRRRAISNALEPLFSALQAAFPELSLPMRAPGPSHTLYRRTVEIRDGLVLLSPYYDRDVAAAAEESSRSAGESDDAMRVSVHAALVTAALEAHRSGARPDNPYHSIVGSADQSNWGSDATSLARLSERFAELNSTGGYTTPASPRQ